MQAEPCRGVKVRRKVDIDLPVEEKYECEMGDRMTYRSLDSVVPTVALRRTLESTPERHKGRSALKTSGLSGTPCRDR